MTLAPGVTGPMAAAWHDGRVGRCRITKKADTGAMPRGAGRTSVVQARPRNLRQGGNVVTNWLRRQWRRFLNARVPGYFNDKW